LALKKNLKSYLKSYLNINRGRKVLESRSLADDERIDALEEQLKERVCCYKKTPAKNTK
jgi:hypothetical protein